jgi:hypothetical protein
VAGLAVEVPIAPRLQEQAGSSLLDLDLDGPDGAIVGVEQVIAEILLERPGQRAACGADDPALERALLKVGRVWTAPLMQGFVE